MRKTLFRILGPTFLWKLLPGRIQGFLCNCDICRGVDA